MISAQIAQIGTVGALIFIDAKSAQNGGTCALHHGQQSHEVIALSAIGHLVMTDGSVPGTLTAAPTGGSLACGRSTIRRQAMIIGMDVRAPLLRTVRV
jgi:hypothetical protein